MTREELKVLLLKNPLSLDHDAIWRHDQAQREEIAVLTKKVHTLTDWYDKMFGTPCEEIRHAQQVEKLEEEIARLKNILCSVDKDHAVRKLNMEIARLREALEEANKQLISTAAGTDEFGGLLRRIRIALAKEATRDNAE